MCQTVSRRMNQILGRGDGPPDVFVFTFTRHPFGHLVSAYFDRIYRNSHLSKISKHFAPIYTFNGLDEK